MENAINVSTGDLRSVRSSSVTNAERKLEENEIGRKFLIRTYS